MNIQPQSILMGSVVAKASGAPDRDVTRIALVSSMIGSFPLGVLIARSLGRAAADRSKIADALLVVGGGLPVAGTGPGTSGMPPPPVPGETTKSGKG